MFDNRRPNFDSIFDMLSRATSAMPKGPEMFGSLDRNFDNFSQQIDLAFRQLNTDLDKYFKAIEFLLDTQFNLKDAKVTDSPRSTSNTWSSSDLIDSFVKSKLKRSNGIGSLPLYIDMSQFLPTFNGLMELTLRNQIEYGKVGYVDIYSGKLTMNQASSGTKDRVCIDTRLPPGCNCMSSKCAFMVHTHPASVFGRRQVEHLSPQDFITFLSLDILATVVLTEGLWLLALKTNKTPAAVSQNEIDGIIHTAQRRGALGDRHSPDWARRATKLIAKHYNLELYVSTPTKRAEFRAVKL